MRGWLAIAAIVLVVLAGVAAHGAWQAMAARDPQGPAPPPRAVTRIPLAAPAPGVTGTIALPAAPPTGTTLADAPLVVARSFSLAGLSAADRGRALECLTAAIYYEAASEPDAGQQAVAQVVLNRVRHAAFPASVCAVVYQGSERAGCQFSFACDGAMARTPSRTGWARAMRAAAMALSGRVFAPVGLATHYHTYAVTPTWNRGLVMTGAVGAHLFHRWKGWWGTAAAFRRSYAGAEPVPGPHIVPSAVPDAAPPPRLVTEAAGNIRLPAPPPAEDPLPQSGQILDRWRDTGQPLD